MHIHTLFTRALLLGLSLLGACASVPPPAAPAAVTATPALPQPSIDAQRQAEFDRSQARWHGAKLQELVSKLGKPSSNTRAADGSQVLVYAKSAKIKGPNGPSVFSCVVRYQIEAQSERIVGHQIEGC
jgi:hypothetical protein